MTSSLLLAMSSSPLAVLLAVLCSACTTTIVEVSAPAPPLTIAPAAWDVCALGDLRGCATSCLAGSPFSCNNLGATYELGREVVVDVGAARELYASACAAHAEGACWNLARVERATPPLVDAGCTARDVVGCAHACLTGSAAGCETLATMYEAGDGVRRDETIAWRLHLFACDDGLVAACDSVQRTQGAAPVGARRLPETTPEGDEGAPSSIDGLALVGDTYVYAAKQA